MAQLINIQPSTELDAVNVLLATIGQAPIEQTDVDTPSTSDVDMALNELRNALRETLSIGWRFNTRRGFQVAPTAQYVWTNVSDGQVTTLNIFKKPSGLLSWKPTECAQMDFSELVEMLSLRYQESGSNVLVLFDAAKNRDGLDATVYPFIYIDTVVPMDFEQMPEEARRYVTVLAARRFAAKNAGAQSLMQFSEPDEDMAFRILVKAHGMKEKVNFFANAEAQEMLGWRPLTYGGGSRRIYPQ